MRKPLILCVLSLITVVSTDAYAATKTIRWIGASVPAQLEGYKKVFAEYTRDKGVKIEAGASLDFGSYNEKLLTGMAAGRFNELVSCGTDFGWQARAKTILPLNSYIKSSGFDLSDESPASIKALSLEGNLYVAPLTFSPLVLFYNKNLFDAAGVLYPTTDWTDKRWNWEAFVETAKKLTKYDASGRITQYGIGGMQWQYFYPWYFGGDWADEGLTKSTITDPRTVKGLQEVADLTLKYKVGGGDFMNGKSAMSVDGAWGLGGYRKLKFQWNIAASPWGTHHAVPAFFDGFSLGASPNSKQGWDFIKWIFADKGRIQRWMDAASSGGTVPTLRSMQAKYLEAGRKNNPGINMEVCVDSMEYATPMILRYSKNWPKIDTLIGNAWNTVLSGKKPARTAMEDINREVDRLIKAGGRR